jgi:hypothetical protein
LVAFICRARRDRFNPREVGFVEDLLKHYRQLTERQARWLYHIEAKLRGRR